MATINGDGYDGNINPHTKLEIFSGVTLGRVTLLSYFGIVDSIYLKVLLHSARIISEQLFYGFNIKRKLYFTYTHLMCRKSVTESVRESEFNKSSVNHQVHADNCLLNDNGKCLKELPAFYWRDFTTILFLNNNFDDGQFNFHQNDFSKSIQSSIQPKCGRLLGFKSGPSNVHSFNSIKNGIGCYIGIWFTFDKQHEEIDHLYANKILEQISLYGSVIDNFTRMYKN